MPYPKQENTHPESLPATAGTPWEEGGTATGIPCWLPPHNPKLALLGATLQGKHNPRDQGGEQGVETVLPRAERTQPGILLSPLNACDTQGGCAIPPWLTPKGKFIPWAAWAMRFWDQTGDDTALTCWWFTFPDRISHYIMLLRISDPLEK